MSFAIPRRNHGFPLLIAGIVIGGAMFAKGLPKPDRFLEKFIEFAPQGIFAFALLLIASWAYHGLDYSPAGRRPIGSIVVLTLVAVLVISASTAVVIDPPKGGNGGAAQQFAVGMWLIIDLIAVSYIHSKWGHSGASRRSGFSFPRRKRSATPTFLSLPGGGGH